MYQRVELFNLPLDLGVELSDIIDGVASGRLLMTYLNPYAYSVARKVPDYAADLRRFDLIVCDGIGVQIAAEAVFKTPTKVISPDLPGSGHAYLEEGASRGFTLCLVGGASEVAEKTARYVQGTYPAFGPVACFSGYGDSPGCAREHILASQTDMVLVGLGMGLQEAFLLDLVDAGWQGVGICVGGTFDRVAEPESAYPAWSERTRLRFLGRLIREPRRLSRRYFIDYRVFIGKYLKYLLGFR
jgi:N-acetylglucosaminyldiphosphoundecaprenol N-acetyl-beta-D-mannosaminyltransferase